MRVTIVHPCIGRRRGQKYIRTWQMEPLPAATLAGLTPKDIDLKFYDDRMEAKIDTLIRLQAGERGDEILQGIDERFLRTGGHARPHDHEGANQRHDR